MCAELVIRPGTVIGGYRVERLLGRGGMGVVYEATQLSLNRRLALKVLHADLRENPSFVERFRREGRLQATLEHPGVVTVHEAGESEHGLFLAMRLVPGTTLAALLRDGSLDAEHALRLLRQVADALDAAHAIGLVHRDVKPRNVLVGEDGRAYLADFGLTRMGADPELTASGELFGTVAYLAPEVIRGEDATAASDRYAFGAMVYECLAGEVVFARPSDAAVLYAHTSEPPPRISDRRTELPPALDAVFERALAKAPLERQPSAAAIVDAVERALGAELIAQLGPPAGAREAAAAAPRSAPRRRRARAGRTAVLVAAALTGAAVSGVATGLAVSGSSGSGADRPPALARGAVALGSDLSGSARSLSCRGRAAPSGAPCSIVQTALSGATLVVPRDGAVVGWTVKGARGELSLQILRRREGRIFQVAKSQYEVVPDERTHHFAANLEVERGDVVGIEVTAGARVGVWTAAAGAETERWFPPVRSAGKADLSAGTGFDHEVLLRVDYVPGGKRRVPEQVTGAAAAAVPAGHVRARKALKLVDGRQLEVALVELGSRVFFDLFSRGQRVARIEAPDIRPGGQIVLFYTLPYDDPSGETGVQWVNRFSGRLLERYYEVYPREFEFVS
jgi:predicted Ser/Thr protein kinase